MSSQTSNQNSENPFIPERPARLGREFVGRQDVFQAVRNSLGKAPVGNPLVVCGPPGIGKTSFLLRLVEGALEERVGVLYTDFQAMDTSAFSGFLWQLAKAIMAGLREQELPLVSIEKRMLLLNPQLVFRQRFWNPLLMRAHSTPLLLAWDNFDMLSKQAWGNRELQSIRAYLYDLLETDAPVDVLMSITGRVEALAESALGPFHLATSQRLTNLSKEQTLALIAGSERMRVPQNVADYIYYLTSGHPRDTQRICHSLYQRHFARGQIQVTIADLVAVLQEDLMPKDFHGLLYDRLKSVTTFGD
jgi:hypothetical protein